MLTPGNLNDIKAASDQLIPWPTTPAKAATDKIVLSRRALAKPTSTLRSFKISMVIWYYEPYRVAVCTACHAIAGAVAGVVAQIARHACGRIGENQRRV